MDRAARVSDASDHVMFHPTLPLRSNLASPSDAWLAQNEMSDGQLRDNYISQEQAHRAYLASSCRCKNDEKLTAP